MRAVARIFDIHLQASASNAELYSSPEFSAEQLPRACSKIGRRDGWSLEMARVEIAAAATAAKMQSPFFRRTEKYAIGQAVVKYCSLVRAQTGHDATRSGHLRAIWS